jgi:hypothetical protein
MARLDIRSILARMGIRPVLVDIGASGEPPSIWKEIAPESIYVGFDPDLREIREVSDGRFHRAYMVNQLVAATEQAEVPFYLTRSPFCSSALKPDAAALSSWIFADLFEVEREVRVAATTIDAVVKRLSLGRIDWLKVDSQGTDLRLFESLGDGVRRGLLAIDIEPTLIDSYQGEDLFGDAHRALTAEGFWLSRFDVFGTVRMATSTLDALSRAEPGVPRALVERGVRRSPCWVEARYLRTVRSLADRAAEKRDYVLAWVFAWIDGQLGACLDLALASERAFGEDEITAIMKREPVERLRQAAVGGKLGRFARAVLPGPVKRWIRRAVGGGAAWSYSVR